MNSNPFNTSDSVSLLRKTTNGFGDRTSDSYSISFSTDDDEKYKRPKNWEEFKKEYYQLEKKIRKSLESLHHQQIEFSKQLSLSEYHLSFDFIVLILISSPGKPKKTDKKELYDSFKTLSADTQKDFKNVSGIFHCRSHNPTLFRCNCCLSL